MYLLNFWNGFKISSNNVCMYFFHAHPTIPIESAIFCMGTLRITIESETVVGNNPIVEVTDSIVNVGESGIPNHFPSPCQRLCWVLLLNAPVTCELKALQYKALQIEHMRQQNNMEIYGIIQNTLEYNRIHWNRKNTLKILSVWFCMYFLNFWNWICFKKHVCMILYVYMFLNFWNSFKIM